MKSIEEICVSIDMKLWRNSHSESTEWSDERYVWSHINEMTPGKCLESVLLMDQALETE